MRRSAFLLLTLTIMTPLFAANRILVHGHRGARAMRPENTIPAFEYAIAQGVDVLELDMAVTKDDVLVVSHDPLINPAICTGAETPGPIRTFTLAELRKWDCGAKRNPLFAKQTPVPGTRIPTLDEVFSLAAPASLEYNIETKIFREHPELTPSPERFAQMVLDCVRRHGLESRVILQSFDFRTLQAMKKLAPDIRLAALDEDEKLGDFVTVAHSAGAGIISPEKGMVTPSRVQAAHQARLQVIPWTANTPQEWDALITAGVDAIISDDPAALIAYLKQKKLR
jgi:glycerophosphoryl diester phosphodiesterase